MKRLSQLFKDNQTLILVTILLIGFVMRFYQLGQIPKSLEWDEVSFGYNAYSVLHTGKDEYGVSYPLIFRAFGEYKQPVYTYLDVVSVALFGLTSFAVRFPSALFGVINILFVYFLVLELFKNNPRQKIIALLSSFFFAISPWSIQFSRSAFEANVALCLVIAGTFLFLKALSNKKAWCFFVSIILYTVSMYTYIGEKFFVPVFMVALFVYGYSYFKVKKLLAVSLIILFLFLNMFWLLNFQTVSRGTGVLFTTQQTQILADSSKSLIQDKKTNNYIGLIIHNRRVIYATVFVQNYLSHFSPNFLFFTGDTVQRDHAPDMGTLYLVSLPFILLGLFYLLKNFNKNIFLLLVWFIIAPIPSAITFEAPHALRSLTYLPTWQIFEAAGLVYLFSVLKNKKVCIIMSLVIVILYLFNIGFYFHQYFSLTNKLYSRFWQDGYSQSIDYTKQFVVKGNNVYFAKDIEQGYIFYLFYTKYNPQKYQSTGGSWRTLKPCYSIDTAYFGDCDTIKSGNYFVTEVSNEPGLRNIWEYKDELGNPIVYVYQKQ